MTHHSSDLQRAKTLAAIDGGMVSRPRGDFQMNTEAHRGYDGLTGRVVLEDTCTTGTLVGAPFSLGMLTGLATAA